MVASPIIGKLSRALGFNAASKLMAREKEIKELPSVEDEIE